MSHGKERIEKIAIFSSTPIGNLYNFGFGDRMANGTIDDQAGSNNGDIVKVLATIIEILKTFLHEHPTAKVSFVGSTHNRTALYGRILKTYYEAFAKQFVISGLIVENNFFKEILFTPSSTEEYLSFYIKNL
jgi:hypothetical protein